MKWQVFIVSAPYSPLMKIRTITTGATFSEEYEKSEVIMIEDIPIRILPLEDIIASKKFLQREKDNVVIPALESALIAKKEMEKRS